MNQSPITSHASNPLPVPVRVAFVQSSWHRDLIDRCRDSFLDAMSEAGIPHGSVDVHHVPGAFEIPLRVQRLARTRTYAAIVAAGLVVDGGIYRHEFVAEAVISGLMRVQLDADVPVLSAVLTPQHFHEHDTHRSFFSDHMVVKGREAAAACLSVLGRAEA
ncbi:6,7-dimethyl-8-ribityllumazine synthase [Microvirga pudoricolor]|uniref:6,7-dimethyl-8-ribityllumazine synthase n=1 Tax=Microvirga pudoricolor TaxID=2778729 RepID=UPI00194DE265|nr:6,7-dimethyl-8-ribityllumazine synthase [Microvirga pudoricolor]MBM6593920.1 6,7-dimethyl-8-ribityllumazine synthase [Microvirga pudoricolor]